MLTIAALHGGVSAMRPIGLTLVLALLALTDLNPSQAAPAPLPRRDREAPRARQQPLLDECRRRLDELKVEWRVVDQDGRRLVRFGVDHPNGRGGAMGGSFQVNGDDLAGTLRQVIKQVEFYFKYKERL
jgi:hypothetical protein